VKLTALQRQMICRLVASCQCREPSRVRLDPYGGIRGAGLNLVKKPAHPLNEL